MFACFAPSRVVKNNEPKDDFKTSKGSKKGSSKKGSSKKGSSKRNRRVKPIDIVNPTITDVSKKRSKPGLKVKPTGIAISSALDGSKKRRNKWGFRVKNTDVSPSIEKGTKDLNLPITKSLPSVEKASSINLNVVTDDGLLRAEQPAGETAYEVVDKHDEIESMKRDLSDTDLQPKVELSSHESNSDLNIYVFEKKTETDEANGLQTMVARKHANDSSIEQTTLMDSTVLKRSCSNNERKKVKGFAKSTRCSSSCNNLDNLLVNGKIEITHETISSSSSVLTSHNADQLMLKRLPSIEILHSRSHSNPHIFRATEKLSSVLSDANKHDEYFTDMHDPDCRFDHKDNKVELENQWVASSLEVSHMDRISAWVNSLDHYSFLPVDDVEEYCDEVEDQQSVGFDQFEINKFSVPKCNETCYHEIEEVAQPNSIIQSLNSFSTVAHISNFGLKIVPSISAFINLRSAILSGNSILQITPGSLPKSLHTLDLSRNKISSIEGLGNLEKLRVLNLSFNRISRIGHGLLSCTLLKELYLAGNKISVVEGLHRVLKLTMLDLSFNKINSTKALGQLVVNYNSLVALNLTGNPIHGTIGYGQLKKEVLNLLPHIAYLNQHSVKPHKVPEVSTSSTAMAALGGCPRRKIARRLSHSSGSSKKRINEGSSRSIKHRSKSMQSSPGRKSSQLTF